MTYSWNTIFQERNQEILSIIVIVLGDHIYVMKEVKRVRMAGDQNWEIIFAVHQPLVIPASTGNQILKTTWSMMGLPYLLPPAGATEGLFFLRGRSPYQDPDRVDIVIIII